MSVIPKLASSLNRNDEAPNQELAQAIAETEDRAAVDELVANLTNKDSAIASDCIKVLYEIGGRQPALIADHAAAFTGLLRNRNNRLVWGSMTALGAIAHLKAADIWPQIDTIMQVTTSGSAITQDWGIRVLAAVTAQDTRYAARIMPYLLTFLKECRPKDLPRHAESVVVAITTANRDAVLSILETRLSSLQPAQAKRVAKLIRQLKAL
jgi:hypothetical protein